MSLSDREADEKEAAIGLLSEDLVQSPTHKAASTKAVDFHGILTPALILHEDLTSGNGGQAWPAGMILGTYLLRRKRDELRDASSMLVSPRNYYSGFICTCNCKQLTEYMSVLNWGPAVGSVGT